MKGLPWVGWGEASCRHAQVALPVMSQSIHLKRCGKMQYSRNDQGASSAVKLTHGLVIPAAGFYVKSTMTVLQINISGAYLWLWTA